MSGSATCKHCVRVGDTFGRYRVLAKAESDAKHNARWLCRCECGVERVVMQQSLTAGRSKSCGCLHREIVANANRTHDGTDTPEYQTWCRMLSRCRNTRDKRFSDYGGRGISVCERWLCFEAFRDDMGPRPHRKSLDRIDCNGNYEPHNCRWATASEQQRNRRTTRMIEFNGERHDVTTWAEKLGIPVGTLNARLRRGWTVERALRNEGS